jgi:hypothetical protein
MKKFLSDTLFSAIGVALAIGLILAIGGVMP